MCAWNGRLRQHRGTSRKGGSGIFTDCNCKVGKNRTPNHSLGDREDTVWGRAHPVKGCIAGEETGRLRRAQGVSRRTHGALGKNPGAKHRASARRAFRCPNKTNKPTRVPKRPEAHVRGRENERGLQRLLLGRYRKRQASGADGKPLSTIEFAVLLCQNAANPS
jgi:hypothetical protein